MIEQAIPVPDVQLHVVAEAVPSWQSPGQKGLAQSKKGFWLTGKGLGAQGPRPAKQNQDRTLLAATGMIPNLQDLTLREVSPPKLGRIEKALSQLCQETEATAEIPDVQGPEATQGSLA